MLLGRYQKKGVLMRVSKSGFTMIELIFVIVILGILAAVALPKLAATRDDAKDAVIVGGLGDCIEMSVGSYMKDGTFDINSSSCNTASVWYPCFTISADNNSGILNIKHSTTTDKACLEAQAVAEGNRLSSSGSGVDHQY